MKTRSILFIVLFVLFAFCVRAQTFNLVDTGKVWTSTYCSYGWATLCNTHYYKIEHDTVIGSAAYKAVWESNDSGLVNPAWYVQGFIREDSSRKVYYRSLSDTQDYPIYDFAVTTGDTAHLVYMSSQPANFVVDSTSTILLQNQLRTVYYLHDPLYAFYIPQVWIEGIGSLNELLVMQSPQVDYSSDLLCFHEHDTLKYFNPDYSDCYYNTTGIQENEFARTIRLSPNPTDGKFTIHFPPHALNEKVTLTITDVSGKIIRQQENDPEENIEMDLSEFPSGIYFVGITGKGISPVIRKVAIY